MSKSQVKQMILKLKPQNLNTFTILKKEMLHLAPHMITGHSRFPVLLQKLLRLLEWTQTRWKSFYGENSTIKVLKKKSSKYHLLMKAMKCLFSSWWILLFLNIVNSSLKINKDKHKKLRKLISNLKSNFQNGCQLITQYFQWSSSIYLRLLMVKN